LESNTKILLVLVCSLTLILQPQIIPVEGQQLRGKSFATISITVEGDRWDPREKAVVRLCLTELMPIVLQIIVQEMTL